MIDSGKYIIVNVGLMISGKPIMEASESYQISHEEMRKYAGRYVAIMDGKVVASGKNLYQKIEEIERKHPNKKILVTYVPTEDLLIL